MHSEVPATLAGARIIHAQELAGILSEGKAVLIDAAAAPRRPEMGSGKLTPEEESFYKDRLNALTASDLDRPLVFYCHPQCWGSWNAAKRALSFGFRNVSWFPDGAEGWQDAGHPLAETQPETPPQAGH
jgi:3-mercaptopyruvate sulfurtransferase SseA